MKLPATHAELIAAGWRPRSRRHCRLCNATIEFWKTLAGKIEPLELTLLEAKPVYVSHWETCPRAGEFKRPEKKKAPDPESGKLFG
ncbi:MAG TPA: hypothetical protein VN976_22050 [Verrucomicrobiae bacterium]|nr:hypothetical protein [Verrucomicrobiae bacterium]